MQRAILSSAAKKVAEIDEITIYGMLTTGRLICKCIDVFAYKSASAYLPLWSLCQETKPELTLATKVISKCRKIITIADRQCAVWYVTLLNALSWSMWPETGKEQKSTIYMQKDSSLENWWLFCEVSLCIEKHTPVKFTLVRNCVLFLANTLGQLFV